MGLIETTKERGDKNNEDCGKTERAMQAMADCRWGPGTETGRKCGAVQDSLTRR